MDKDIIVIILTSSAVAGIITFTLGWLKEFINEKREESKRLSKIREDSYKEIMANIDFIYEGNEVGKSIEKKEKFLQNYRIMFLYSTDSIIKGVNRMWEVLGADSTEDDSKMKNKKSKIGKVMLALRKEINKDTQLTEDDFKHIK